MLLHKTVLNYCFIWSQILREIYIWPNFCRIRPFSLPNSYVKNVQFGKNFKFSRFSFINLLFLMCINKILIKNYRNFVSGFFPDFPDPVFSRNFFVEKLGEGQTRCHFLSYVNIFHILYKFFWWQKVADMKNAKNCFYVVRQILKISLKFQFLRSSHSKG